MSFGDRGAFAVDRLRAGWAIESAAPIARVVHPFDDGDSPPQTLQRKIARRSEDLATRLPQHDERAALLGARSAVRDYWNWSVEERDIALAERWQALHHELDAAHDRL